MQPKEELSMGVEWGYLKTLLRHYDTMVARYSIYILSTKKLAHPREKMHFQCAMSVFYSTVKYTFDSWLENTERKEYIPKYQTPPDKDEELIKMYFDLNVWAQSTGPFKTLVKKNDPFNAFKHG